MTRYGPLVPSVAFKMACRLARGRITHLLNFAVRSCWKYVAARVAPGLGTKHTHLTGMLCVCCRLAQTESAVPGISDASRRESAPGYHSCETAVWFYDASM